MAEPKDFRDYSKNPLVGKHVRKDGSLLAPRGLTEEVYRNIVIATRYGASLTLAAQAAGLNPWTVRRWLREAAVLEEEGKTKDDDIRIKLAHALPKARARRAIKALQQIQKAAEDPRNWTAAAWYLERTYPEQYGKQDRAPFDWKEELRKMGVSPEEAMEMMVKATMEEIEAGGDPDVIDSEASEVISGTEG